MSLYEVSAQFVPTVTDGTYTYNRVNAYGPATPTRVTVHDGCLFSLVLGEGQDAEECPTKWLADAQSATLAELAWHVRHGLTHGSVRNWRWPRDAPLFPQRPP